MRAAARGCDPSAALVSVPVRGPVRCVRTGADEAQALARDVCGSASGSTPPLSAGAFALGVDVSAGLVESDTILPPQTRGDEIAPCDARVRGSAQENKQVNTCGLDWRRARSRAAAPAGLIKRMMERDIHFGAPDGGFEAALTE